MAIGTPKYPPVRFTPFLTLILLTSLPSSSSLPIFSLSHSLLIRVAKLRATRGDVVGSNRVRTIARNMQKHSHDFSFYGLMWSVGWDYLKNYARRDVRTTSLEMRGAVSDMNELIKGLRELTQLESEVDRVEWERRNYATLLKVSNSLLNRFLKVFTQPGPLKDAVEMVRTEIVNGGLLQDCLELGRSDLKVVIQILKDVTTSSSRGNKEL